jgi:hypothetical protein
MKLNSKSKKNDFDIDTEDIKGYFLYLAAKEDKCRDNPYYNDNSAVFFTKIPYQDNIDECKGILHYFDFDKGGYERSYKIPQYFDCLKNEVKDEAKAKIIFDLFFATNPLFNKFHWTWTDWIPQDKPRLLFCGILCSIKDTPIVNACLEFIYSAFNLKDSYQDCILKMQAGGYSVFLIDISTFYHITNANIFAVRKGFEGNLKLIKGEKTESIGRNDYNAQADPKNNPYHPDNLSVQQKIRIGTAHKEAVEWAKNNGGDVYTSR